MKYVKARRDWTIVQRKGMTMGKCTAAIDKQTPISPAHATFLPFPAASVDVLREVRPERILDAVSLGNHCHVSRAGLYSLGASEKLQATASCAVRIVGGTRRV